MSRSSIILVLGGLIFILLVNSIFIVNEKEKALSYAEQFTWSKN